eukprot:TRINITY_DN840_c0_g1_i2.p1 TRINITY_DN840_c0_g1~~TRINITY_DN840_c0_g1_i2.p1  ORF type:complete len:544 (+),score=160.59 TRINITY_DN840_c0_g1_i2:53-1684(+)
MSRNIQDDVQLLQHEDVFEDTPSYQILKPRHDPETGLLMTHADFIDKYSPVNGFPLGKAQDIWEAAKERNPPLLECKYRLETHDVAKALQRREPENFLMANSDAQKNAFHKALSWLGLPCFCPCFFSCCVQQFEVPTGALRPVMDGQGGFLLAGEGVHEHWTPFMRVEDRLYSYTESNAPLVFGDWCIVVVNQGFIGLAMDKGQPVLLPPGFHQWKSSTLKFEKVIDMNEPVIYLGPYTLLTVDEGYAAVTQNNGKQEIKGGGAVHFLAHRNHKFEKFLSTKIQTDNLARIEVITADNVLMLTDATVNWRISDVELAARNAAETMRGSSDIEKLRNDILKQASASLSSFIGTVNYSDSFSPTAQVQNAPTMGTPVGQETSILFDIGRMQNAVGHANSITSKYGVEIIGINIISAKPADPNLMNSLAKGAVAAAEAQQLETAAKGNATAIRIKANAEADAQLVEAKTRAACLAIAAESEAAAEEVRAEGAKKAADFIASSSVAVELTKIDRTGSAIDKANASLFFGADAGNMGSLLSNPKVVSK